MVPLPSYEPGSAELAAYTYLQDARALCGFGLVAQNTALDQANKAHAQYLTEASDAQNSWIGHGESDLNNPHFTGNGPWDRASAAGYGPEVREILAAKTATGDKASHAPQSAAVRGEEGMRDLMNTVYHLQDALYPGKDVGFGASLKLLETQVLGVTVVTDFFRLGSLNGYQSGMQLLGAGQVATYPCAGSTGIDYAFAPATEDPNPFPELTKATQQVGPPIYMRADMGSTLTITDHELRSADGEAIALRTDYVNDGAVHSHEFFMIPASPLKPLTAYTARIAGTANGQAFDRRFTFTTRTRP